MITSIIVDAAFHSLLITIPPLSLCFPLSAGLILNNLKQPQENFILVVCSIHIHVYRINKITISHELTALITNVVQQFQYNFNTIQQYGKTFIASTMLLYMLKINSYS